MSPTGSPPLRGSAWPLRGRGCGRRRLARALRRAARTRAPAGPGRGATTRAGSRACPSGSGPPCRGASSAAAFAATSGSRCPGPDIRAPAPHRQQCDVDALRQPAHAVEDVRVAREVDARAALDHEADGAEVIGEPQPAPVVHGLRHDHVHVPHAHAVARRDGDRRVPGPPLDEPRRPRAARAPGPRPAGRAATAGRGGRSARARRGSRRAEAGGSGTATSRRMWRTRSPSTGSVSSRVPSTSIRVVA